MDEQDLKGGADGAAGQAGGAAPTDEIKNLKAEMARKLENQGNELKKLTESLNALLTPKRPAAEKAEPTLEDVWYDKPLAAAATIKEQTKAEIREELAKQQAAQAKQQQVLMKLTSDFPELTQSDHELTQKAIETFNAYSDEEKSHPLAYADAVKTAALELGVMPKSKRKSSQDDSFALGGGSGQSRSRRSAAETGEVDPRTAEFARIMGFDMDDAKVKARIAQRSKRSSWSKYQ